MLPSFLDTSRAKQSSFHPAHALAGIAQAAQPLPCYPDCINTKSTVTPAATSFLLSNNNQDSWQQQSKISDQLFLRDFDSGQQKQGHPKLSAKHSKRSRWSVT